MTQNKYPEEALTIVWTTVDSKSAAQHLATSMLHSRLAACVQIDSPVESHYRWEGREQVDTEYRLIIKSRASLTVELIAYLTENHPYDEPQILVTEVTAAAAGYARWVIEQTTR